MEELELMFDTILREAAADNEDAAFDAFIRYNSLIQQFIVFIVSNNVISSEEADKIASYLVSALENRDLPLLDDVMRYALFSIYEQIMEDE